eukprot:CAMPEP_0178437446 /NCGR_PEP_ID=MMETSP0689_2-20121128/35002_1 /TAXON_ID=160604 /ORGANISM="Amphidinium massartii, Strain CS-259" /LENGTH=63 /DNA_ID=CAMNT_0020059659 /DNA_START=39 /DNA_END=227 /DNA_ORIENTATION=+
MTVKRTFLGFSLLWSSLSTSFHTAAGAAASASGAVFVELLGNLTYPEGILERPNGDIFVGGFG